MFNPRQEKFLALYLDPKSKTFADAKNSAIEAGFSESYANTIIADSFGVKWIQNMKNDSLIVAKALENLHKFLQDEENKGYQWDATKFSLSRLDKRFKEKSEVAVLQIDLVEALKESRKIRNESNSTVNSKMVEKSDSVYPRHLEFISPTS